MSKSNLWRWASYLALLGTPACTVSDDESIEDDLETDEAELLTPNVGLDANFPWVVSVAGDEPCQGVLINQRQVLTAAHCVDATAHPTVAYRRRNPTTGVSTSGTTASTTVILHTGYYLAADDLAIVTMAAPFAPDPLLVPAELPLTRSAAGDAIVVASSANVTAVGKVGFANGTVFSVGPAIEISLPTTRACRTDAGAGVIRSSGGRNYVVSVITDPVHGTTSCGVLGLEVSTANLVHHLDFIAKSQYALGLTAGFDSRVQEVGESADFGLPANYEAIVGDFNGDGKTDYGRLGPDDAYFYQHDAPLYSMSSVYYSLGGLHFGAGWQTTVGDFNGDGKSDIARLGNTGAWVFFGNGSTLGNFTVGFHNFFPVDFGLTGKYQLVTGDFDGNGRSDFARLDDDRAFVYYGNADKTFSRHDHVYGGGLHFQAPSPWNLAVADFNGDGRTDYARLGVDGAFVFYGQLAKAFTIGFLDYGVLAFPVPASYQVIAGDFNADGKGDFGLLDATLTRFYLGGTSGFTALSHAYGGLNFGLPSQWKVITGDWNADGRTDYARLGDTGGYFFHAKTTSPFGFTPLFQNLLHNYGLPSPLQVIAGDFDDNGKTDYIQLTGIYEQAYFKP